MKKIGTFLQQFKINAKEPLFLPTSESMVSVVTVILIALSIYLAIPHHDNTPQAFIIYGIIWLMTLVFIALVTINYLQHRNRKKEE